MGETVKQWVFVFIDHEMRHSNNHWAQWATFNGYILFIFVFSVLFGVGATKWVGVGVAASRCALPPFGGRSAAEPALSILDRAKTKKKNSNPQPVRFRVICRSAIPERGG